MFAHKCDVLLGNIKSKKDDDIIGIVTDMIHLMCILYMEASFMEALIDLLGKASNLEGTDIDMLKKMGTKMLKNIMYVNEEEIIF